MSGPLDPIAAMLRDQLASTIAAAGGQDGNNGFGQSVYRLTGTVKSWNEQTNTNVVTINKTDVQNVLVLLTGTNVQYFPGDTVFILKMDDSYIVLGKVGLPGANTPSQLQFNVRNAALTVTPTAGVWTAFSDGGPIVTVTVGASRKVEVKWSCDVNVSQGDLEIGWSASGTSQFAAGTFANTSVHSGNANGGATTISTPAYGSYVLTGSGINPGVSTFQMMYRCTVSGGGTGAAVGNRMLSVEPK